MANGAGHDGRGERGRSITAKVNLIIILTLTLGLGGMTLYFGLSLISTREELTHHASAQAGDLLYQSIKNFMIPGEAPLAVSLFRDIALIRAGFTIGLFRRTGDFAFSDNTTLETVNRNLKQTRFQPHDRPPPANPEKPIEPWFSRALKPMPNEVFFTTTTGGKVFSYS